VEGRGGGRELIERLEVLREAIREYYGMLSEIEHGLKPEKIVERPDVLEIIDRCKLMNIHRVDADYEHQPYIWMLEYQTAIQEENEFNARRIASGVIDNGAKPT
jgi:hypothetical protein